MFVPTMQVDFSLHPTIGKKSKFSIKINFLNFFHNKFIKIDFFVKIFNDFFHDKKNFIKKKVENFHYFCCCALKLTVVGTGDK